MYGGASNEQYGVAKKSEVVLLIFIETIIVIAHIIYGRSVSKPIMGI